MVEHDRWARKGTRRYKVCIGVARREVARVGLRVDVVGIALVEVVADIALRKVVAAGIILRERALG